MSGPLIAIRTVLLFGGARGLARGVELPHSGSLGTYVVGFLVTTAGLYGVFLTFSDFVMKTLAATRPAAGTEAMQIINRNAYRPISTVMLIGMIPISVIVAIGSRLNLPHEIAYILMLGGVFYFFWVFVVSAVGNIPMNQKPESVPQVGVAAQAYWRDCVKALGALEPYSLDGSSWYLSMLLFQCDFVGLGGQVVRKSLILMTKSLVFGLALSLGFYPGC